MPEAIEQVQDEEAEPDYRRCLNVRLCEPVEASDGHSQGNGRDAGLGIAAANRPQPQCKRLGERTDFDDIIGDDESPLRMPALRGSPVGREGMVAPAVWKGQVALWTLLRSLVDGASLGDGGEG